MVTELAEGALLTAPLFLGFILHGLCIRLGVLRGSATPIERRWFGENKTYRGVICVALGTAVGFVVIDPRFLSLGGGHRATELAVLGLLVGTAAMLAELPNSFLKRRMGIAPGTQTGGIRGVAFHVLDQIDVVFGAWGGSSVGGHAHWGAVGWRAWHGVHGHRLCRWWATGSACARAHGNERAGGRRRRTRG